MSSLRRTSQIQGPPGPPGTAQGTPAAWTPGAISNGAFASLSVAVTGANVGFACFPAFSLVLPDGVWLWAQTTVAGTVKVYMFNISGSPQTIGAGTIYVEVLTQ